MDKEKFFNFIFNNFIIFLFTSSSGEKNISILEK
jgi:hypothetical protein